jgi:NodT family efflux transporter outer membrane factor (OMF) lipoprotein
VTLRRVGTRKATAIHAGAIRTGLFASLAFVSACAVAPRYARPEVPLPPSYKELGNWQTAQPGDDALRGKWWEIYEDPQLSALEERLTVSNNTLKAAQAQFEQARALVRTAQAATLPLINGSSSINRTGQSVNKPNPSKTPDYSDFMLRADASYEVDLWGRVRQTILANKASAQASAADVESVGLSLHAELALDYFQLRALDAEKQIVDQSVVAFERALELTTNRYNGGIASAVDVAFAQTQLETTRAQSIDLTIRRAQFEHAIATLMGQPPATFSLAPASLASTPPVLPAGLPSVVLERRPDIAAAERRMAAAHAQIGLARTAYFPTVSLTGTAGLEGATLGNWLKLASNLWSVAPSAVVALFDGGRRKAASDQALAAYQRTEAIYRETILTAFREVEDNLSNLRILADEARVQDLAVASAERSLRLSTERYRGGVTTYLEVITTQNTALQNQRTALNIRSRRLTASVALIKALGGGWNQSALPRF